MDNLISRENIALLDQLIELANYGMLELEIVLKHLEDITMRYLMPLSTVLETNWQLQAQMVLPEYIMSLPEHA